MLFLPNRIVWNRKNRANLKRVNYAQHFDIVSRCGQGEGTLENAGKTPNKLIKIANICKRIDCPRCAIHFNYSANEFQVHLFVGTKWKAAPRKRKKFKQSEQKLHSFAAKKSERPCMCGYKANGRERRVKCGKMHSNRIESNPIWESNYWILQHQTDCCVADYSGIILYDHILQFDYTFCECGFFLLWCKTNSIFQTKYSTLVAHFWVLADENN